MAAYTVVSADSQVSETFTRFPHNTSELGTCPASAAELALDSRW
jgi:hypothetical protein